jgi:hypothetical protein
LAKTSPYIHTIVAKVLKAPYKAKNENRLICLLHCFHNTALQTEYFSVDRFCREDITYDASPQSKHAFWGLSIQFENHNAFMTYDYEQIFPADN